MNHSPTVFLSQMYTKMHYFTLLMRENGDFDRGVVVIAGIAIVAILLLINVLIGLRLEKDARDRNNERKNGQ